MAYPVFLENEYKLRLVELLVLVGGILGAFKLTDNLLLIYILFLLFSIVYFIVISSNLYTHMGVANNRKFLFKFLCFLVASFFSAVVSAILGKILVSVWGILFGIIITLTYFVVLSALFYLALVRENPTATLK